jgi:hypothetical protein
MTNTTRFITAAALRRLADVLDAVDLPTPTEITRCIIADDDSTGTAVMDQICAELSRHDIAYRRDDNDHDYTVTIDCGEDFAYRIFYIYRAAMAAHDARCSYEDNLRLTLAAETTS